MKPIAGLNLEYFVIGAVASLWLTPALFTLNLIQIPPNADSSAGVIAATLIPAIYVVGMVSSDLLYQ